LNVVLACLVDQHDWPAVAVAALVCLSGLATALAVFDRAMDATGRTRLAWTGLAAMTGGLSAWATHFIAMLGFSPGGPVAYDLLPTLVSMFIALAAGGATAVIGVFGNDLRARIAAAVAGACGVAAMHYVGMSALRFGGTLSWDPALIAVSIILPAGLAAAAAVAHSHRGPRGVFTAAGLGALAICTLHFTGMAAMRLAPDPTVILPVQALDTRAILIAVAVVLTVIVLAGAVASALSWWSRLSAMRQIREAIEAMPDGMAFFDANDRLVLWNARYAEVNPELTSKLSTGMTFREIVRLGMAEGLYTEATGREEAWIEERMQARCQRLASMEQHIAGDRWLRVQDRRTAKGGVVTVCTDITDLKRDAQALVEARDAADAANQAKSQFLANMSHEIRTPLNGVIGVAQALSRTPLAADQREMLDLIQSSGHTLQTLLSDILDLARVESGRMQIMAEPFELERAIQDAARLYSATATDKGLQFFVNIAPEARTWVLGDVVRLKQILTNLVSNAVKFTQSGFISLSVQPGPDRAGAPTLRFSVEDTGIGFDARTRERLFARFEQADGGITRRFGGSGLGLSICRQLADMMQGELDCESEPGGGSAFFLTLPFLPVEAPVVHVDAGPTSLGDVVPTLRVLLADDHPTNRKVVEMILAASAVELFQVENGAEALEAYRAGEYDLVLMDMQMPVMDGLAATREIRLHEAAMGRTRAPIVMLTANALPEHIQAGVEAGADRHLSKPFSATDLLTLVMDVATRGPTALAA